MSNPDAYSLEQASKDFTFYTQAINQLLVALGCEDKHRSFIDCLIGVSQGKVDFEASDVELANQIRPLNKNVKTDSLKKWVARHRKSFMDWQNDNFLQLVMCETGYWDKRNNDYVKSKYHLNILVYAEQIISIAKEHDLWEQEPVYFIQKATYEYMRRKKIEPMYIPPGKPYLKPGKLIVTQRLRSARSYIEGVFRILDNEKIDEFSSKEERKRLEQIKELLDKYKPQEESEETEVESPKEEAVFDLAQLRGGKRRELPQSRGGRKQGK